MTGVTCGLNDTELRAAATGVLTKVAGILREATHKEDRSLPVEAWTRGDQGFFRRGLRLWPWERTAIQTALEKGLSSSDEWGQLQKAVRNSSAPLGKMVGTGLGVIEMSEESACDSLVFLFAERARGHVEDPDAIAMATSLTIDEWLELLLGSSETYVWTAPILGLDVPSRPISLGARATLVQLTDEEVSKCLEMGVHQGIIRGQDWIQGLAGVRIECSLERVSGSEIPATRNQDAAKTVEWVHAQVVLTLAALRIHHPGGIACPVVILRGKGWAGRGAFLATPLVDASPLPVGERYVWSTEDFIDPGFEGFWRSFTEATGNPALRVGASRFSSACSRKDPADRLTDLLVCAEALFLAGGERGELSYRLALRISTYLEGSRFSRRQLLDHMRRAYNARSALVHGEEPSGRRLRKVLKDPADPSRALTIDEFTKETEGILRQALRQAVTSESRPTNGLVEDWDTLIVGR